MTFVKSEIKPLKKGADMGSLLRRIKERKKTRRLGEVEVMEQEGYGELEVDSKVEMIRALVPLGLMHVHELLDAEVSELAGERYVRKSENGAGTTSRDESGHGETRGSASSNPRSPCSRPRRRDPVELVRESESPRRGGRVASTKSAVRDLVPKL